MTDVKRYNWNELAYEGVTLCGEFVLASDYDAAVEAKLRVLRREFGQVCSYCGWEAKPSGGSWDELQAHIRECKKHPLAVANTEINMLRAQLRTVLDHVDYINGNCLINELVGATLPIKVLQNALDTLERKSV